LPPIDPFAFEHAEEAFRGCIVCTGSNGTHAALDLMSFQESLIFIAGELTAAIRVKNDRTSIGSLPQRHQDGLQYELAVLAGRDCPARC
jgi:hypothetical protein